MRYLRYFFWLAFLCPPSLLADANLFDWLGVYTMNHDGHVGTLTISDTKNLCRVSPWCHLQVSYKDDAGNILPARIALMDQNWQHMVFFIQFPGGAQRFDSYLFSWDKTKIAGTTIWQGQTFGMFATRNAPETAGITPFRRRVESTMVTGMAHPATGGSGGRCTPSGTPSTVVAPNGAVELHYPDGSIKTWARCGYEITCPNGSRIPVQCLEMEAIPPTPPPAPNDDATKKWLKYHNDSLMDILTGLLGNNQNSVQNYKNSYEQGSPSLYQQMTARTSVIQHMLSGQ